MSRQTKLVRWAVAVGLSLGLSANAHSTLIPDQVFETPAICCFVTDGGVTWQQGVTAGQDGLLGQVDVFYGGNFSSAPNGPPADVLFFLNLGAPWQDDPNDFEQTLRFNAGDAAQRVIIDVSAADIRLQPGDEFVIGLSGLSTNAGVRPSFTGSVVGDAYPGGTLWFQTLGGNPQELPVSDLNFATYIKLPAPIPEPPVLAMLMLGLVGLRGMGARRAA